MTSALARHQRRLTEIAYRLFAPVQWFGRKRISWVVGVEEVALMTRHIADAIPGSYAVVQQPHPFYDVEYDAVIRDDAGRFGKYRRQYGGPIVFAWLLRRADGFLYVGRSGFLDIVDDERRFEFAFAKRHGKRIVAYFTGTDIRSIERMCELAERDGRPNVGSILAEARPELRSERFEGPLERRAAVADEYADAVYSMSVDQRSYLQRPTLPFLYFYPDDRFTADFSRFDAPERIVVLHAPSNPTVKGTEFVRAAMERVCAEHPEVEYRELTGASNAEVLAALDESHLVLNQFFAFVPGVFGIEAMARGAAMLCSADPALEPDLGPEAAVAWKITPVERIAEHVLALLDDPDELRAQAVRGNEWARSHASASASARSLRAELDALAAR